MNPPLTLFTALLLPPLSASHGSESLKQTPNILFILPDDLGWGIAMAARMVVNVVYQ